MTTIFGALFGDSWDGYHDAVKGIQPDHGSDAYWRGWWAAQSDPRLIAAMPEKKYDMDSKEKETP